MGMKEAETILRLWRELERELETADQDSREELHARITELRDRYQALVAEVYDVEAAGGPAEGGAGAA
jgi:propanediol dehydratase small subunit